MSKKKYYLTMKRIAIQSNLGRTVLVREPPGGIRVVRTKASRPASIPIPEEVNVGYQI